MYAPMTTPAERITTIADAIMAADLYVRADIDHERATATLYGYAGHVVTVQHDATSPAHQRYILQTYENAEDFAGRYAWDCYATADITRTLERFADKANALI